MTEKIIWALAAAGWLALILFVGCAPAQAQDAEPCAFCPNVQCIDSGICGYGCFCLKVGSAPMGRCASVN